MSVIEKREAYSLDKLHLRLLSVYLANQKQVIKVVVACNSNKILLVEFHRELYLGPC